MVPWPHQPWRHRHLNTRAACTPPWLQGGSIASLLTRFGPLDEPVIRTFTRQLLEGLAYLHAQRTVHRGERRNPP